MSWIISLVVCCVVYFGLYFINNDDLLYLYKTTIFLIDCYSFRSKLHLILHLTVTMLNFKRFFPISPIFLLYYILDIFYIHLDFVYNLSLVSWKITTSRQKDEFRGFKTEMKQLPRRSPLRRFPQFYYLRKKNYFTNNFDTSTHCGLSIWVYHYLYLIMNTL